MPSNPIVKHNSLEPGGLIKFNGCYYVNGQGGWVGTKRALVTYVSYDFEHWSDGVILGFRRDVPPYPTAPGAHSGEQVHVGASLWNRGNVVLGFYGQWHGHVSNDRSLVTMDIGFIVSNDAIHFVEPIPDFQIISGYEIFLEDMPRYTPPFPALVQGQGFENMGDQTLTWYSPWTGGFVCVAKWPRDRLGYFTMVQEGGEADPQTRKPAAPTPENVLKILPQKVEPHFISCPIDLERPKARIFINAEGLSENGYLKVEVLDQQFRPVPEFSGDNCIPLTESGFRQQVSWRSNQLLEKFEHPIRVKVSWAGSRIEDIYLYAVYLYEEG